MSKFISATLTAVIFVAVVPVSFIAGTFPVLYVIGSVEEGRLLTLEDFQNELPSRYDAY